MLHSSNRAVSQSFLNTPLGSAATTAGRNAAICSAHTRCAYLSMALRAGWPPALAVACPKFVHLALRAKGLVLISFWVCPALPHCADPQHAAEQLR